MNHSGKTPGFEPAEAAAGSLPAERSDMAKLKVGRPQVTPDKPAHTRGVRQGNSRGHYEKQPGHLPDGRSTAKRSTGVNPKSRDPILPEMPNLSPP
jgi:hypothetical protein